VTASAQPPRPTTRDAIAAALPELPGHVVVCANGYISRWACALGDRDTHFYMIGSMGLASSIALGVATARPGVPIAVLDGDGNVLMNLGALPMIGVLAPERFRHVVLDNGVYASTGNQPTISSRVALEDLARAAGYRAVARVASAAEVAPALRGQLTRPGPSLLLVETLPEAGPPAPRIPFTPPEMAARLRAAIMRLALKHEAAAS
jgi:thiamine pyrophosphate-dependent acetolactate synthase large subunit-like protein